MPDYEIISNVLNPEEPNHNKEITLTTIILETNLEIFALQLEQVIEEVEKLIKIKPKERIKIIIRKNKIDRLYSLKGLKSIQKKIGALNELRPYSRKNG